MKASRIVAFALCVMLAAMSVVIIVGAADDLITLARQASDSGNPDSTDAPDRPDDPDAKPHPQAPIAEAIAAVLYGVIFIVCLIVCLSGIICSLVNVVKPCAVGWMRKISICALAVNSLALLLVVIDIIVR